MRRGLMAWSESELPRDALEQRIAHLQRELARVEHDAMLIYTNFIRSAAVSHLTAFSPYWADGVLMVPRAGEPVFATTLSNRVATWVEAVKPVGKLIHTPQPGVTLAQALLSRSARRLSILELDAFPGGLFDEIRQTAPEIEIVEGAPAFAAMRSRLDRYELGLLEKADAIARQALDAADRPSESDAGQIVGLVEREARRLGAEEAYVAISSNLLIDRRFRRVAAADPLGQSFAVRIACAYKGAWIRRTRSFSRSVEGASVYAELNAWCAKLLASLNPREDIGDQLAEASRDLPGSTIASWLAETAKGTRPLAPAASSVAPGEAGASAISLNMQIEFRSSVWLGGGLASCSPSP